VVSRRSRSAISFEGARVAATPFFQLLIALSAARSHCGEKDFTRASGKTTVPISRPSAPVRRLRKARWPRAVRNGPRQRAPGGIVAGPFGDVRVTSGVQKQISSRSGRIERISSARASRQSLAVVQVTRPDVRPRPPAGTAHHYREAPTPAALLRRG